MLLKLIIFSLLIIISPDILANAGTPLMWLSLFHLTIGNLIIGVLEGLMISFLLKIKQVKSIFVMILANYLSAGMGLLIIEILSKNRPERLELFYFNNIQISLFIIISILFIVTYLVEFALFQLFYKEIRKEWIKTLKSMLVIQFISYSLIIPLYNLSSINTFSKNWIVKNINKVENSKGYIFYIDKKNNLLKRVNLNDFSDHLTVEKIPNTIRPVHIYLDFSNEKKIPIMVKGYENKKGGHSKVIKLNTAVDFYLGSQIWKKEYNFVLQSVNEIDSSNKNKYNNAIFKYQSCSNKIKDYSNNQNDWKVKRVGGWAIEGIVFEKIKDPEHKIKLAVEVPPFLWRCRCATVLPNNIALFEFGNKIVLADINKSEISWISLGSSPIVFLEE